MFDISDLSRRLRRHITTRDILYVAIVAVIYFVTRVYRLDRFPIFTDEGIYIHWAKIAWKDPAWRLISLTDGKQPLHTWGMIPFFKLFPNNLLLGGRMFSVLSGGVALTGIFTTALYLFNKKTAYIAAALYVATPMFLFYDRMALADSAVNAGFIWVFFGSILLVRTLRLDVALMYGIVAGFALLTKSSSQMFLGLAIFAPILDHTHTARTTKRHILNYIVLLAISVSIAFGIYNVQRLSPYFHYINEKNATFVMTPREFIKAPFQQLFGNIPLVPYYVFSEMGYVVAALGIIGIAGMYFKKKRLAIYMIIWLIAPYLIISLGAKVIFPRYLIFFASLLTLAAAYFVGSVRYSTRIIALAIVLLSVAYFDLTIVADYTHIPFPPVDRGQYIESFNAGWGVEDMITYARLHSSDKPVVLLGEGNFGVISDMLDASIPVGAPISVHGYWPLNKEDLVANQHLLDTHHVYIVFSHREQFEGDWPMKLIQKYPKPTGGSSYYMYELTR